jgi:lysozyme
MKIYIEKPAAFTLVLLTIGLLLFVGRYLFLEGYLRFNYPSFERFPLRGIDISNHQGKINWQALRQEKFHFIYIKATEGGDFKDRRFSANWQAAAEIGLVRGAYHFFTFCKSGKDQAKNYLSSVPVESGILPPVLDIEYSGNCKQRPEREDLLKEVQDFINEVKPVYNMQPILYVTEEIYETYLTEYSSDMPIWIRDIYFEPELGEDNIWVFWQYANRGRVKGINGPVDLNVFNGRDKEFKRLLSTVKK